jgi:hypothetical protein
MNSGRAYTFNSFNGTRASFDASYRHRIGCSSHPLSSDRLACAFISVISKQLLRLRSRNCHKSIDCSRRWMLRTLLLCTSLRKSSITGFPSRSRRIGTLGSSVTFGEVYGSDSGQFCSSVVPIILKPMGKPR